MKNVRRDIEKPERKTTQGKREEEEKERVERDENIT